MDEKRRRLENTLDFYNEKMTKKAVGRLFQEYIEDGEENYFFPPDKDEVNAQKKQAKDSYNEENKEPEGKNIQPRNNAQNYEDYNEEEYVEENQQYDEDYNEGYNDEYEDYADEDYYDENGYEQEEYADEGYDDEYEEYMQDNPDVDYNKNYSYDTVKLYSPRRKRTTKQRTSKRDKYERENSPNKKAMAKGEKNNRKKAKKKRENIEEQYYEENNSFSFATLILGFFSIAFLIAIIVLCFKLSSANTEIKHLNNRLKEYEGENLTGVSATKMLEEKKKAQEESKLEINTENSEAVNSADNSNANTSISKENNSSLNNTQEATTSNKIENSSDSKKTNQGTEEKIENSTSSSNAEEKTNSQLPKTYTVEKGDNAWKISKKVYGTGDYYLKILEANKLDENGALVVGQEIVIPEV